jgi:hypothetical protein
MKSRARSGTFSQVSTDPKFSFPFTIGTKTLLDIIKKISEKETGVTTRERLKNSKTYENCAVAMSCVDWILKNTKLCESENTEERRNSIKTFCQRKQKFFKKISSAGHWNF